MFLLHYPPIRATHHQAGATPEPVTSVDSLMPWVPVAYSGGGGDGCSGGGQPARAARLPWGTWQVPTAVAATATVPAWGGWKPTFAAEALQLWDSCKPKAASTAALPPPAWGVWQPPAAVAAPPLHAAASVECLAAAGCLPGGTTIRAAPPDQDLDNGVWVAAAQVPNSRAGDALHRVRESGTALGTEPCAEARTGNGGLARGSMCGAIFSEPHGSGASNGSAGSAGNAGSWGSAASSGRGSSGGCAEPVQLLACEPLMLASPLLPLRSANDDAAAPVAGTNADAASHQPTSPFLTPPACKGLPPRLIPADAEVAASAATNATGADAHFERPAAAIVNAAAAKPGAAAVDSGTSVPTTLSSLDPVVLLCLALDVARGMAYLHGFGLAAKVCDFGLSGHPGNGATHLSGACRRCLLYSAPELVSSGASSPASDCDAFGVVLWELALGRDLPSVLADERLGAGVRAWMARQPVAAFEGEESHKVEDRNEEEDKEEPVAAFEGEESHKVEDRNEEEDKEEVPAAWPATVGRVAQEHKGSPGSDGI
ncbi:Proline-rich receptor-like protein kinase PERK2 [Tetrabaena socialis]|uniref:Proline-rich receptor-like protein kinase PERK2 n=1 Tax=Tetrabaena socialis TaxID=47790 RepID=A0A2J7ZSU3_9CHLO|nr:Proline-rich receptor-like protein kinase PERK2 [Tetrabaena socialis]|eukprot:PNH03343.1 Proline-rich receptor-like protein kinase PERK2 [Tetrabaena socialis]